MKEWFETLRLWFRLLLWRLRTVAAGSDSRFVLTGTLSAAASSRPDRFAGHLGKLFQKLRQQKRRWMKTVARAIANLPNLVAKVPTRGRGWLRSPNAGVSTPVDWPARCWPIRCRTDQCEPTEGRPVGMATPVGTGVKVDAGPLPESSGRKLFRRRFGTPALQAV